MFGVVVLWSTFVCGVFVVGFGFVCFLCVCVWLFSFCFVLFFNGLHNSRTWGLTKTSVKCGAQQQGAFWLWSMRECTMTAVLESS